MPQVLVTYRFEDKAAPYLKALQDVGLLPVKAKAGPDLPSFHGIDGILLSGGNDLDPQLYGQEQEIRTVEVDSERDAFEIGILTEALRCGLPVLCICRGLQLLNVHFGGTLHQDIAGHRILTPENPGTPQHKVILKPNSKLHEIFGQPQVAVNTRHHQAIDRLGAHVQATAFAPDGTIEGIELDGARFVLGVQWHPEDQVQQDPMNRKLFERFAETVTK